MQTATSGTIVSPVAPKWPVRRSTKMPTINKDNQSTKESKVCHNIRKTKRRLYNQGCKYKKSSEGSWTRPKHLSQKQVSKQASIRSWSFFVCFCKPVLLVFFPCLRGLDFRFTTPESGKSKPSLSYLHRNPNCHFMNRPRTGQVKSRCWASNLSSNLSATSVLLCVFLNTCCHVV